MEKLEMLNLQEDTKPEVIVEHGEMDVIAAFLIVSIIVGPLGIGDPQVSDGNRVCKNGKDRRTRCKVMVSDIQRTVWDMQLPNTTAHDIGLSVDKENNEVDWNPCLEGEENGMHSEG